MPIPADRKSDYGEEYHGVCAIVDRRAKWRCEQCRCFRLKTVRLFGTRQPGPADPGLNPTLMFYRLQMFSRPWVDECGREIKGKPPDLWEGNKKAQLRFYNKAVVLTHAHLNQNWKDNRPENISLLCDACHNKHDGKPRAVHAAETRKAHKDALRPLLVAAEAEGGAR